MVKPTEQAQRGLGNFDTRLYFKTEARGSPHHNFIHPRTEFGSDDRQQEQAQGCLG